MTRVQVVLACSFRGGRARLGMRYVATTLAPTLFRLGLRVEAAWYRQAGTGPELVLVGLLDSPAAARELIAAPQFQRLRHELAGFTDNLTCRVEPVSAITLF